MKTKTEYIKRINFFLPIALLLDIIAVVCDGMFTYQLRDFPVPVETELYAVAIAFGALYLTITARLLGTYRIQNNYKIQYPLQRIILSWVVAMVLLALTAYLTKTGEYFSRLWFLYWSISGAMFLVTVKIIFLSIFYSRYFRKWNQTNIILIGTGKNISLVASQIQNSGYNWLNIIGKIQIDMPGENHSNSSINNLGELEQISTIANENSAHEIWIALPLKEEEKIKKTLHLLRYDTFNIRMIPDIFELRLLNQSLTDIAGIPVINLCESPMTGTNHLIKLAEDKILSVIFLLFCSPLFILIPVIIKLTSKGPVFYYQERVGWNGKTFKIIKFRTMPINAEDTTGPVWATSTDNRATRFGSFLRRSSLDEIPQFINVLKGEMSIVGPRPERPEFVDQFKEHIPGYMQKHMVKAGITGWAQVNGWRGDTDLTMRISHDLYYIENWSLMLDLKIIALTIIKGFVNVNAY